MKNGRSSSLLVWSIAFSLALLCGCETPGGVRPSAPPVHGRGPYRAFLTAFPDPHAPPVGDFKPGGDYAILSMTKRGGENWYQVTDGAGASGWVRRSLLRRARRISPIFVQAPLGGALRDGQQIEIRWTAQSDVGNFNVVLFKDGSPVRPIAENTSATVGRNPDGTLPDSFTGILPYYITWVVPGDLPPGRGYSIRISDFSGAHYDQSPAFAIVLRRGR